MENNIFFVCVHVCWRPGVPSSCCKLWWRISTRYSADGIILKKYTKTNVQFHFLRKWQELSWGLGQSVGASTWFTSTTIDGLRVSLGGLEIVTLREKQTLNWLWCNRWYTWRTGYTCSISGVTVRSIYKMLIWKNFKFFLQGTIHSPCSLPTSLNMLYMNFYQPASHQEESEH